MLPNLNRRYCAFPVFDLAWSRVEKTDLLRDDAAVTAGGDVRTDGCGRCRAAGHLVAVLCCCDCDVLTLGNVPDPGRLVCLHSQSIINMYSQ
jgi:hypothetical protein